jgi:transcription antitermination factor NusG
VAGLRDGGRRAALDRAREGAGPGSAAPAGDAHWFALYTRSRQERTVEAGLRRLGLATYLPMLQKVRRWSDRKKVVEVPYFPGYVFLRCGEEQRSTAWAVPGAVRFLGAEGRATAIDSGEIESIRDALSRRIPFDPHPRLEPGQQVTIANGPLSGLTGILVRRQRKYRLVLCIKAMGQGISAEVDAIDVAPA